MTQLLELDASLINSFLNLFNFGVLRDKLCF